MKNAIATKGRNLTTNESEKLQNYIVNAQILGFQISRIRPK